MTLAHTRITPASGDPDRWLFVIHGIYGTGRNWGSLVRRLVDGAEGWGAILVDLRLHGDSLGLPGPHTVRACAEDLRELETSLGIRPSAIIGHSFGGKVGLLRVAADPEGIQQLWVADSTLQVQAPAGSAWRVLDLVRGLPEDFGSRDELADAAVRNGYDRAMGQWLAMNLERQGDRFRWRLDWAGMEELLRDYFATDVWPIIENPPGDVTIHVVRAVKSDSLDQASVARIRAAAERTGRVALHEVEAGHWLNVDNPDAVLALLGGYF